MPLPTPTPSQLLFVKKVKVTSPVGSKAAFPSETVALSCTFVPKATDELSAITVSLALLCSSVAVEDFTEDSSRLKPGEAGQVQSSLGVPGTTEHTSLPGPQREDVSRTQEIVGSTRRIRQRPDRRCSIIH